VQTPAKLFYGLTRDLHLYLGLFIAPFVLIFAVSTFFLVHAWLPGGSPPLATRTASGLDMPANLELLSGREQVNAIRPVMNRLGVPGEIGNIRRVSKEHRLIVTAVVPGRETTVDLHFDTNSATISRQTTGLAGALVYLHKMPGPHNQNLRGNSLFIQAWRWLADAVVYLVLFLSASGVYLWTVLRAERRIGLMLLAAGALSFFGMIYVISR